MTRTAFAPRDAGMAVHVALAACVSWVVPEALWQPLARGIGRVLTFVPALGSGALPFDAALAAQLGCSVRALGVERTAAGHASRLYGLREWRPRWTHEVPVRIDGRQHLAGALESGAGAVLWVGRFAWASLITKMGLHRAGVPVTHLSRPTHGFGESDFAVRQLNPFWTRIEDRFLRERIMLSPGAETAALRALRRRLGENGVVSIAVGDQAARTVGVSVLGVPRKLATGPMHLALTSRAPLIPVFTVRDEGGRFLVALEPPLDVRGLTGREERERDVGEQYASRLEAWVRRYPGQWLG
jgi:lauroyl/myristoyl acyltransferase